MSISYSIEEVPNLNSEDGEKKYAARVNSAGKVTLDELCNLITNRSTVSSADVKAVLDSFNFGFKHYLSKGFRLELDELGIFSPSLTTQVVGEKDGVPRYEVKVTGINYRTTAKLKKEISTFKVLCHEKKKGKTYSEVERLKRILNYVKKNRYIDRKKCQNLNSCTSYKALIDLKALIASGKLATVGSGRSLVYVEG